MAKKLAIKTLGAVDATTAGASVSTQETPFITGVNALLNIVFNTVVGASGVIDVQTSPDGTNWTTVFQTTAGVAKTRYEVDITLDKYIRAQPSVVFTSGSYDAYLVEGIGG